MNDEMKKLLSRFLFTSVLICCMGLLVSGGITASQKSAKNAFDKAYAVMSIRQTGNRLEIITGDESYKIELKLREKIKRYEDYILLTPIASVYFFADRLTKITTDR